MINHTKTSPQAENNRAWPFITRRTYMIAGKIAVWHSRQHRKGLGLPQQPDNALPLPFWHRARYNWSIGAVFAAGSFLFMLASVMSLMQTAGVHLSSNLINIIFFLGSIPFTCAAFMQLIQAANACEVPSDQDKTHPKPFELVGWHPRHAGWLSSYTQFLGTLAFNMNTFNAILGPSQWYVKDAVIWLPDIVGSTLFLISAYLAFIEAGHRYWSWRPAELSWQIVFINLLGCIAFMNAALLGYYPAEAEAGWVATLSTIFTLIGAACFFIAALLSCRESKSGIS